MNTTIASFLRHLSPADFAALGMQDMAYVKETDVNGARAYAVHAADGTQLTVMESRDDGLRRLRAERSGSRQRALTKPPAPNDQIHAPDCPARA